MSNPPPPSKNRENQDAAVFSQSQPSTSEEVEARAGRPATVAPNTTTAGGSAGQARRDGDPLDQSERATDADVDERARPGPSRLDESVG